MKSVTGREIFEAIKKNGWNWVTDQYIDYNPITGEIFGACAIGQADLNLGLSIENTIFDWYHKDEPYHPFSEYLTKITDYNDEQVTHTHSNSDDDEIDSWEDCDITYHTYDEIVAYAETILKPVFDTVFDFEELSFTPR